MIAAADRRPGRLYGIADVGRLGVDHTVASVLEMAAAGVTTIQLRAKRLADEPLNALVADLFERLGSRGFDLWIDDRIDLARIHGFTGVHLGQLDLQPATARKLLPGATLLGLSTHTLEQVRTANDDPSVDWVAFGPVFPTRSKENAGSVVGLEALSLARGATVKPLIAIGGVDETNAEEAFAAGADSVALISALCDGDVAANSRRLLARLAAVSA